MWNLKNKRTHTENKLNVTRWRRESGMGEKGDTIKKYKLPVIVTGT